MVVVVVVKPSYLLFHKSFMTVSVSLYLREPISSVCGGCGGGGGGGLGGGGCCCWWWWWKNRPIYYSTNRL